MTLEKLGMMLFLDYWNQFNGIKQHLSQSLSELIKALEETLCLVKKGSGQLSLHPVQGAIIAKLFAPLEQLLRYSEKKCGTEAPSPQISSELKNHVIQSLIDALTKEMDQIGAVEALQNPLKIKALESVKKVLLEQQGIHPASEDQAPETNSETDDVVISLAANGAVSTLHFQADRSDEDLLPQMKTA